MSQESESQQVPYVGLPIVDKVALREVRFELGTAHSEWVAAWHAQMYVLARQGTTFGTFSTTVRSFVDSYGGVVPNENDPDGYFPGWLELCLALWRAFEKHGIVEVDGDPADLSKKFRVRVVDFGETNRPMRPRTSTDAERRAKDAERKRRERARKKASFAGVSEASTDASRDVRVRARSENSREDRDTRSVPPVAPRGVDNSTTDGLTFQHEPSPPPLRRDIDDATAHEIDRLLGTLRDADDGTRGVLEHLARQGAGPAEFADAREAVGIIKPNRPSGYAVRTITNRLVESLSPTNPTIGATA